MPTGPALARRLLRILLAFADVPAVIGETRIGLVYHGSFSASSVGF